MLIKFIIYTLALVNLVISKYIGDSSSTLFDSNGRIAQLDKAFEASYKGETLLALSSKDYIVILTLNKINNDNIVKIPSKLRKLTNFMGITGTGIVSDINHLSEMTFKEFLKMKHSGLYPHITRISSNVAHHIQKKTMTALDRPYGVALCLFSYDSVLSETNLCTIDSSGIIQIVDYAVLGENHNKLAKNCNNKLKQQLIDMNLDNLMKNAFNTIETILHLQTKDNNDNDDINDNADDNTNINNIINVQDYIDQEKLTVYVLGKNIPLQRIHPSILKTIKNNNYQHVENYLK